MHLDQRIREAFSTYLASHALRDDGYTVDEKYFGNSIATFIGDGTIVRFVTDRDDLYIDFASSDDPEEWFSFDTLLELLGYPWGCLTGLSDFEVANILNREHAKLVALLSPEKISETQEKIDTLARQPRPLPH